VRKCLRIQKINKLFYLLIILFIFGLQNLNQMKMKAILIDVKANELRYVQVTKDSEGSSLKSMYKHIGCDLVQPIQIDPKNDVFVDEEGLLKLDADSKFFAYGMYPQPLAGNGLILGIDHETGETISTTLTLEEVREKVFFLYLQTIRAVYC